MSLTPHKLLWPPNVLDIAGSGLLFLSGALAAVGGVGGGPLHFSVFLFVQLWDAHQSVGLSKAVTFGGAIGALCVNLWSIKRYGGPQISWGAVLLLEPATVVGIVIGVQVNLLLPAWLIMILGALLMAATSFRLFRRGYRMWNRPGGQEKGKRSDSPPTSSSDVAPGDLELQEEGVGHGKTKDIKPQQFSIPVTASDLLLFIVVVLAVACVSIGATFYKKYSVGYWGFAGAKLAVGIAGIFLIARRLCAVQNKLKSAFALRLISVGFVAGLVMGVVGIGAGMIKSPVLMAMGLEPLSATATTSTMILFTAFSGLAQFAIAGAVPWDYGVWSGFVGLLGFGVGRAILVVVSKRWKMKAPAITVLVAAFVICVAMVGLVATSTMRLLNK